MENYYAHSTGFVDKSDWQLLEDHLHNVSNRCEEFAAVFHAGDWEQWAGILHDAGKATKAFQRRLEGDTKRVDHSTFGARLAWKRCGRLGILLAYAIAGHHGGLPNGGEQKGQLYYRLKYGKIPEDVHLLPRLESSENLNLAFPLTKGIAGFSLSFFTRMIFSCLVDADFLDTEQFCSPHRAKERQHRQDQNQLSLLLDELHAYMENIQSFSPVK